MGEYIIINSRPDLSITVENIMQYGTLIFNRYNLKGLSFSTTDIYHFSVYPYPNNNSITGYYMACTMSNPVYGSASTNSDNITNWSNETVYYKGTIPVYVYNFTPGNQNNLFPVITSSYNSIQEAVNSLPIASLYPITYHYTNSTVTGPSEAAVGDTVTVSAVPDVGYGITDTSTQILVTNNDIAVPYTWDSANNRITFTMPDPS